MYRGHKLFEIARHITVYGRVSESDKELLIKFDRPSWNRLHRVGESFRERDLFTQSRFHDTLNHKYPSVKAYIKDLKKILIGDMEPKMNLMTFNFGDNKLRYREHLLRRFGPPPKRMPPKGYYFERGMKI